MERCIICRKTHDPNISCGDAKYPCLTCGELIVGMESWTVHDMRPLCKKCYDERKNIRPKMMGDNEINNLINDQT